MYGQMDFLPFGPTYFSAFLFGEVNTQFEELLQFYVHFLWIQNTWTHNQRKKTKKKNTGPPNKWTDNVNIDQVDTIYFIENWKLKIQ